MGHKVVDSVEVFSEVWKKYFFLLDYGLDRECLVKQRRVGNLQGFKWLG